MIIDVMLGIWIPFLGTALGAACVFFMRGEMDKRVQSALSGFAAGIMVAASVWSLLVPAMERAETWGRLSFLPAVIGLFFGLAALLAVDIITPRLFSFEGHRSLMVAAVTLHNFPEGMAVGAVFAGILSGDQGITLAGAMALSVGIAVQNFPEGAIISMPRRSAGCSLGMAFATGVLSGVVEPVGALLTLAAASLAVPVLPFFLGFAAGSMLYVVVGELIPEVSQGHHPYLGNTMFAVGFSLMMALDVALG